MEGFNDLLGGDMEHHSRSFNSALSATSAISGSSSSKAVLAALRALQDKIRRLETERSQALDECAQLRLQLKNQEIEYEHVKQREQLSAQKSLQEAKSSNERLLHEKNEMEMKLLKLEERTQQLSHSSDELHVKIRMLEEEKHAGILKIKELEHQQSKIEQQIAIAQQKEKDMAQSLVWENRRHEEEMSTLQERLARTQNDFSAYSKEKTGMEIKLAELDQLVSQLLVLNESLVSQLSGRPMKSIISKPSSATKKKSKKTTKSPTIISPRAADLSTSSRSITTPNASKLVPVKTADLEQLKAMHRMYSGMAKSLIRPSRSSSPTSKKKSSKSPSRSRLSESGGEGSISKAHDTRMGRKKGILTNASSIGPGGMSASKYYENSFDDNSQFNNPLNNSMSSNKEVRIPKSAVSFDHSYDSDYLSARSGGEESGQEEFTTRKDFHDYLSSRHQSSSSAGMLSQRSSIGTTKERKQELNEMIADLEIEFDSLNSQYRQLLNNVNASSSIVPTSTSPEYIQNQAEEIVSVIQKLHEKGEQLRQLKSPSK